jgi:hypothetical protein
MNARIGILYVTSWRRYETRACLSVPNSFVCFRGSENLDCGFLGYDIL